MKSLPHQESIFIFLFVIAPGAFPVPGAQGGRRAAGEGVSVYPEASGGIDLSEWTLAFGYVDTGLAPVLWSTCP